MVQRAVASARQSFSRNVLGSPETGGGAGGGGVGWGREGWGGAGGGGGWWRRRVEPLTLKGSTAWRARLCGHLVKAFSSHSFTWAARGVWSGRSLSARTASGSHVVVAIPRRTLGFRV